jgi:hypothetical protein
MTVTPATQYFSAQASVRGEHMSKFVAYYIVLPIGIATVVIALSGVLCAVVRLWTVGDEGDKDINRGRWDWRWWRWWIMLA